jgi:type II secretory pathway component GspD/PulD (secretin)
MKHTPLFVCIALLASSCVAPLSKSPQLDSLLDAYQRDSQASMAQRAQSQGIGIRSLSVSGKGHKARLTADLTNASVPRVIEQVFAESGASFTLDDVTLGGRVTAQFTNQPLTGALNTILKNEGLRASWDGKKFSIGQRTYPSAQTTDTPHHEELPPSGAPLSAEAPAASQHEPHHELPPVSPPPAAPSEGDESIEREVALTQLDAADAFALLKNLGMSGEMGANPLAGALGGILGALAAPGAATSTAPPPANHAQLRSGSFPSGVKALVQPANNSIILKGPRARVDEATRTIRKIDVATPHVLIEGLVVEYSATDLQALESALSNVGGGRWSGLNTNFSSILTPGISFTNTAGQSNTWALSAALTLLVSQDKARVVSRPYLSTLSRQTATIDISRNRYVVTQQATEGATITAPQAVTAGVILQVSPVVYADGRVKMNVSVQDSEFIPTDANIAVEVDKNSAQTNMEVYSGESIVIGGLNSSRRATNFVGVPFLRHIPILNLLFAGQASNDETREVVIFLTPRIWSPGVTPPIPNKDLFGTQASVDSTLAPIEKALLSLE